MSGPFGLRRSGIGGIAATMGFAAPVPSRKPSTIAFVAIACLPKREATVGPAAMIRLIVSYYDSVEQKNPQSAWAIRGPRELSIGS